MSLTVYCQIFKFVFNQVSGARFWKLFKELCICPDRFFQHCFVHNLCPLLFISKTGRNVSPPELPLEARRKLNSACDQSLCELVRLLRVKVIVAVGQYAHDRAAIAIQSGDVRDVSVVKIMHPSPANPSANKDWSGIVMKQLGDLGLMSYLK